MPGHLNWRAGALQMHFESGPRYLTRVCVWCTWEVNGGGDGGGSEVVSARHTLTQIVF